MPSIADGSDDFINVLLSGCDSVSDSAQWSPSPSDSGISEDPQSDNMDSPPPPDSPPLDSHFYGCMQTPIKAALGMVGPSVARGLDAWQSGFFPGTSGGMQHTPDVHKTQQSLGLALTVKDLLLSGTMEPLQQPSQQGVQELILSEDEKKLLAKEGVTLPSQLPLTKFEERVLKKIRRKIRNKQSAQESRKKKKEYIDGLESRMAACSAQNQELQRKVFQLEKHNMSLMEQLRRLQALVMNSSNKAVQTGTCILVLLLSFSLILVPSLQPFSDSRVSREGDFSPVRVQSRSLHHVQSSRVVHILNQPYSVPEEPKGLEKIRSLLSRPHAVQMSSDSDTISHNSSVEQQGHYDGDPITGHVTTMTWTARRSKPLQPHADDM
ncbi:cyclic AMP-responsive element-binding protein 3-like protein 3-A isoform X2 [Scleropages formosus]|nr:cyclic AMP-responsive element-binding protein 3-like protein 3-B isoform X2 [Scleropages formosus]